MKKTVKIIGGAVLDHIRGDVWFDRQLHRYYHVLKGDRLLTIPSVTQIIREHSQPPPVSKRIMERAAARGSDVHLACFLADKERFDESTLIPEYKGYYDAFQAWRADERPLTKLVEQPLYDPTLDVCGTMDYFGAFPKREADILVDYKTGAPVSTHEVQLAAYAMMAYGKDWLKLRVAPLYLGKDGRYRFPVLKVEAQIRAGSIWLEWAREYNLRRHSLGEMPTVRG